MDDILEHENLKKTNKTSASYRVYPTTLTTNVFAYLVKLYLYRVVLLNDIVYLP